MTKRSWLRSAPGRVLGLALAAGLALAPGLRAQEEVGSTGKMGIALLGGYMALSGGGLGGAPSFGLQLTYSFSRNVALFVEGQYVTSKVGTPTVTGLSKGSLGMIPVQLGLQARFPVSDRIVPYIQAGAGYFVNSFSLDGAVKSGWDAVGLTLDEKVDSGIGFHGGAGLEIFVSPSFALQLGARYTMHKPKGTWTLTDQGSDASVTGEITDLKLSAVSFGLGLKFAF